MVAPALPGHDLGQLLNLRISLLICKMGVKNFRVVVRLNRTIHVKHLDISLAQGKCLMTVIIIDIIHTLAEKIKEKELLKSDWDRGRE